VNYIFANVCKLLEIKRIKTTRISQIEQSVRAHSQGVRWISKMLHFERPDEFGQMDTLRHFCIQHDTSHFSLSIYLSTCLSVCLSVCLSIYDSTALCWTSAAFSVSWSFTQTVGLLGMVIGPSQGRYLHTEHHHRQRSMPRVGFEPKIPSFDQAKRVYALDRAAIVIGAICQYTSANHESDESQADIPCDLTLSILLSADYRNLVLRISETDILLKGNYLRNSPSSNWSCEI
jgi:hypothetical protein